MPLHIILPTWANVFIGLPTLLVMATAINWLTAQWMHPFVSKERGALTASSLFLKLCAFSVLSAVMGTAAAGLHFNQILALVVLAALATYLVSRLYLPRMLWIIVVAICLPTFFIGVICVEENTIMAFFLAIGGIITVMMFTMFVLIMNMLSNRYR